MFCVMISELLFLVCIDDCGFPGRLLRVLLIV